MNTDLPTSLDAGTPPVAGSLDVLAAAQRLRERGEPFALVSVVRALAPTSARPGDKAIATAEGIVHGWIGGGCAQPAVVRTVREALADGRARLIRIAPTDRTEIRDVSEALGDVLEFGMSCHSGGTLELFIDPVLPAARMVVIGDSPVAAALAGLAPRVGFEVMNVVPPEASDAAVAQVGALPPGAFAVVATQGRRDLQGLRAALSMRARGVWFVASAKKAEVLKGSLRAGGVDPQAVASIIAPAGQPIGAVTPEEIALSVLAAVVAARRGGAPAEQAGAPTLGASAPSTEGAPADADAVRARVRERLERARAAQASSQLPAAASRGATVAPGGGATPSVTPKAGQPAEPGALPIVAPTAGGSCCGG